MNEQDSQILTNIQQTLAIDPNATQRDMAEKSNISLGQMNAVLKRCMERGWIAVKNLNMKKVCYYLTPQGMEEVSTRTSRYMMNTFSLMNEYAEKVQTALEKIKADGKTGVVLEGKSNIDFLIEYTCEKVGLSLKKVEQEVWECGMMGDDCTFILKGECELQKTSALDEFVTVIEMVNNQFIK